jgi:hypothetical protein
MAPLDGVELGPDEAEISAAANAMLDWSGWGQPPWSADQWAALARALELGQESGKTN